MTAAGLSDGLDAKWITVEITTALGSTPRDQGTMMWVSETAVEGTKPLAGKDDDVGREQLERRRLIGGSGLRQDLLQRAPASASVRDVESHERGSAGAQARRVPALVGGTEVVLGNLLETDRR